MNVVKCDECGACGPANVGYDVLAGQGWSLDDGDHLCPACSEMPNCESCWGRFTHEQLDCDGLCADCRGLDEDELEDEDEDLDEDDFDDDFLDDEDDEELFDEDDDEWGDRSDE